MAKFTPRPWVYLAGHDNASETENVLGGIRQACGEQLNIARIWADGPSPEADANLIAAAPEMYEAMAEFVHRCDIGEVRSKKTYAKFKEIIAKADGVSMENGE